MVYIAPGGKQLKVLGEKNPYIHISDEKPYKGLKPSINVMIKSISELKECSKKIIIAIMTGMGSDGVEGVQELKGSNNQCKVIAQDEESCTIYGMPKSIIDAGLADYVVSDDYIVEIIKKIVGDRNGC